MYATSEKTLVDAVTELLKEKENFPRFVKRFEKFFVRRKEWVLAYRQNLLTRQNNTNNYAEASIRIFKDTVLCWTKAFNVVALVDFCVSMWEPHLKKKIVRICSFSKK